MVRGYRFFLSPWLGSACRFEPTCSAYALDALGRHGATIGVALAAGPHRPLPSLVRRRPRSGPGDAAPTVHRAAPAGAAHVGSAARVF